MAGFLKVKHPPQRDKKTGQYKTRDGKTVSVKKRRKKIAAKKYEVRTPGHLEAVFRKKADAKGYANELRGTGARRVYVRQSTKNVARDQHVLYGGR